MTAQELSWYALWGATALYAIAMVASSIHLARVADAKAAAKGKVRSAVGASSAGSSAAEGDAATTSARASAIPAEPMRTKAAGIAASTTLVGAVLQGIGVVARGIEAGHVPWSTMYEYTITGTWVAVVVFLIVQRKRDVSYLAPGVTGFAAIALGLGLTTLYQASTGLQPALQSFWLVIHVSIAIIATGVFTVAFVATVLQLMRDRREDEPVDTAGASNALIRWGRQWRNANLRLLKRLRWLEGVPEPEKLEALSFRLHAVGFVLWTFTVMAGAVWAEHAWGRYWGWDPKEVWSFVIWVIYAAYLHARTTQGWAGRRSAYIAVAGFVALLMNFTVVNLVFQGLHSYAGV
ncbi:c-type cytochrome biogenesis protein CcsB [Demequina activiva]|uniref:C-type cytochrome biogenesis protein CcsB n=1 Tax=Demequina activiva TaxID=1582364 RepID=A0A919Q6X3_9MICO|nr:c-type cytochrome biogenesis protein CcsB [Demequina activiva]GIG54920.1 c-type cytochrome biogenesis protein CcsB [Demequina activiva]